MNKRFLIFERTNKRHTLLSLKLSDDRDLRTFVYNGLIKIVKRLLKSHLFPQLERIIHLRFDFGWLATLCDLVNAFYLRGLLEMCQCCRRESQREFQVKSGDRMAAKNNERQRLTYLISCGKDVIYVMYMIYGQR